MAVGVVFADPGLGRELTSVLTSEPKASVEERSVSGAMAAVASSACRALNEPRELCYVLFTVWTDGELEDGGTTGTPGPLLGIETLDLGLANMFGP